MVVSIIINGPVKLNTFTNTIGIVILPVALYKVCNKIADHTFMIIAGQIYVSQEIQLIMNYKWLISEIPSSFITDHS